MSANTQHAKATRPIPEIMVITDRPPPAAAGRRALPPDVAHVVKKADDLQPGGWFVWTAPPTSWRVISRKHLAAVSATAYLTYDGSLVVKTLRTGPDKPESPAVSSSTAATPPKATPVMPAAVVAGEVARVPHDRDQRAVLRAILKVGTNATKSNLAAAMGRPACPADALATLVTAGLVASKTSASGRSEYFLTKAGTDAVFAVMREERT